MSGLSVSKLAVAYGRTRAVHDVTFRVAPSEIVALLGPNGAGKSTTLLACAGQISYAGDVRIGDVVASVASADVARLVGLADQPPSVYEYFTVREHLGFVAQATARDGAAAEKLLFDLGLVRVADRLCRELSFGTKQRVGLAAALLGEPRVLLLDETLGGLDPHALRRAESAIQQAAAGGAAVLTSTHLLSVAARLCHRALFMHKGVLVAEATGPFAADELETLYAKHIPDDLAL